jgi:hypothetical protein
MAAARFSSRTKSTINANKRAAATFRSYLSEKNQPTDFANFDKVRLNEALAHFYINLRKTDGDKYKVNSLENIRHSLSRYLQAPPFLKTFDLVKVEDFRDANVNFRAVLAELKREGKGSVDHHPVISDSDLGRIYGYFNTDTPTGLFYKVQMDIRLYFNTDTPTGLFNKVKMDIRLYFFRRGSENMHEVTRYILC